jgi:protease-4
VRAEVLRVGSHKTAAELLTRHNLSPEHREQLEALLDDWYEAWVDAIARGRGREPGTVRDWIDRGPHRAPRALEEGWIDACRQPDEAQDEIVSRSPGASRVEDVRMVDGAAYLTLRAGNPGWRPLSGDLPRVAYVVAQGAIRRGHGLRGVASDVYRELFERLRRDEGVAGAVLRIESPGGDALASDLLWRAVRVLGRDKPVVVSLGDVAASGGYYLAAAGQTVLAEPVTLTGSIGVVGGKLNLEGLYERVGVARDALDRGARAGLFSETRGFTPDERGAVREEMRAVYDLFLDRVAEGRSLDRDEVARRAEGRIYSGARAREVGLVDAPGGPLEAVEEVRRRAGLDPEARILLEVLPRMPRLGSLRAVLAASGAWTSAWGALAGPAVEPDRWL